MTLVIAGHNIRKDNRHPGLKGSIAGLFVTADSTITDGRQTLLSGFKKVYKVPINVYAPSIAGGQFRGYHAVRLATNCFIGFAGSTITAQHILNGVTNHLSALRYAYEGGGRAVPGVYQILMDCQSNSLNNSGTWWGNDMFLDQDMENLLSGEIVAKTVLHVLRISLRSAKRHKIDEAGWKSLLTQYVVGTYCEVTRRHKLYVFKPRFKWLEQQVVDIEVDREELQPGELAVLGMTSFEARAKVAYNAALEGGQDVAKVMHDFLNLAIDEVQENGGLEIDRPSILRVFQQGELLELQRTS